METKKCKKCEKVKGLCKFRKTEYKKKDGETSVYYSHECKECGFVKYKKNRAKYYKKNAAILKERSNKWRKENADKIICRAKKSSDKLEDIYIIRILANKSTLSRKEIRENPELIEVKRLIIKTKRLCETLKN